MTRRIAAVAVLAPLWVVAAWLLWRSSLPAYHLPHLNEAALFPPHVLHRAQRFSSGERLLWLGQTITQLVTETSSTIALLGPDDHREAFSSDDPAVRGRLQSVGRLVPGLELQVRDDDGRPLPPGEAGLLFIRGEQVSGEYAHGSVLDDEGWFPTRDRGWVDGGGYLFIEGRADDTIIRGGENIAPAEIEEVLLSCDGVADAAVVGLPDDEWGQRLAAVIVPRGGAEPDAESLRQQVRGRLRSSKTPETIEFWTEIPRTDTGKLLRRLVADKLAAG